ncbi:MAG: hypothetical protein ABH832_01860 [bacterium]
MNILDFFKGFVGHTLLDIVGGFIVWVIKGCKKNKLNKEVSHTGWRNEAVFYLSLIILITIFFLVIILIV